MGENEAAAILEKTLNEEKETDAKLTELAGQINASANSEGTEDEETEEEGEEEETRASMQRQIAFRKRLILFLPAAGDWRLAFVAGCIFVSLSSEDRLWPLLRRRLRRLEQYP